MLLLFHAFVAEPGSKRTNGWTRPCLRRSCISPASNSMITLLASEGFCSIDVIVFGTNTTRPCTDGGGTLAPWVRVDGATISWGKDTGGKGSSTCTWTWLEEEEANADADLFPVTLPALLLLLLLAEAAAVSASVTNISVGIQKQINECLKLVSSHLRLRLVLGGPFRLVVPREEVRGGGVRKGSLRRGPIQLATSHWSKGKNLLPTAECATGAGCKT